MGVLYRPIPGGGHKGKHKYSPSGDRLVRVRSEGQGKEEHPAIQVQGQGYLCPQGSCVQRQGYLYAQGMLVAQPDI